MLLPGPANRIQVRVIAAVAPCCLDSLAKNRDPGTSSAWTILRPRPRVQGSRPRPGPRPLNTLEDFTMRYFLGLDVAKDSFVAALLDEAGQVLSTASFPNNLDGFSALLAWLPAPAQTIGVCEPTGVYHQHLKQTLAAALESLHEINSQTLKQYAFSQVR